MTLKTLGPKAAQLIAELYEQSRPVFNLEEARKITGLHEKSARNFLASLIRRGVVTRLRPGLYNLVPFELGHESQYMSDPFIIARELVKLSYRVKFQKAYQQSPYYLSHASAMQIHQMVTQPSLVIVTSTTRAIKNQDILGMEFRFVHCKPKDFFGVEESWVTKTEKITVSDLERTIIDGLKQPEYCGGLTEVAKGLWIKREAVEVHKLVKYALKLNIGAVIRRLGFLLELYEFHATPEIQKLRGHLTATYMLLDPSLLREGKFMAKWRLRLNVSPEELLNVTRT